MSVSNKEQNLNSAIYAVTICIYFCQPLRFVFDYTLLFWESERDVDKPQDKWQCTYIL